MIEGVFVKKLQKNEDERGWLAEIFRKDQDNGYCPAMAYISLTKPGAVRGPHEHSQQTDFFIFPGQGRFAVFLWDRRDFSQTKGENIKIETKEDECLAVIVPPGVVHGYKCVSKVPGLCINLPDKLYRGQGRQEAIDEIRWENREDSPYQIE